MAACNPGDDVELGMDGDDGRGRDTAGHEDSSLGLSEKEIFNIAEAISDEMAVLRLGIELGFKGVKVDQFLKTNRVDGEMTSRGTHHMLESWGNKTSLANQRIEMRKALVQSGLTAVGEKHLPMDPVRPSPMTPREVERCRKDLVQYYLEDACKIKTSPLDPDNYLKLDKIYINLKLEAKENQPTSPKMAPIQYENIMSLPTKRVMIVGEAGLGKTTFCAKIAYDWATETHFQNIELLIFILLSEVHDQKSLGEVVKQRLSDSNDVKERQIDEYARTNPDKVLVLLDGLDEFSGKAKIIREILEANKLKSCQVIVTTRPSKVQEISTKDRLSKIYTRVHIDGFTKGQIKQYVEQFFRLTDQKAGESLLHFIKEQGGLVSETIAPNPFYCAMLCRMWQDEDRREVIKELQNIFQFFKELITQLKERHMSKTIGEGEKLDYEKFDPCFKVLSNMAYEGLVNKKMIFDKGSLEGDDLALAYEVGILSTKGKRLAPRAVRRKTGNRFIEEVVFTHKLLQEFMASVHLSSCYDNDDDPDHGKFKGMLEENMMEDYMEFRYVFYFTAARDPDIGRDTMELLRRRKVHEDFIVDIAFECRNKTMSETFTKSLLSRDPAVQLTDYMEAHTVTAYLYAMDTFDDLDKLAYKKTSLSETLSRQAAETTFTSQKLHELSLSEANFHEEFYVVMANKAESSKIQKVTHRDSNLSKDDSLRYGIGLCNMPQLLELELEGVYVYPSFYGPFADPSTKCKIQKLRLSRQAFNKATFQALLSAPSIRSLTLDRLMVLSRDEEEKPDATVPHVDSHVTELDVDEKTLLASRGLGLQTSCSEVTSVTLRCFSDDLTKGVIQNLRFPLLNDLHLIGSTDVDTCMEESTSICSPLTESWPELTSLTLSNILMDDAQVENILQTARRHRSLKILKFLKCFSEDEYIEHLCAEIREGSKLDIEIDVAGDEEFLVSDEECKYSRREPLDPPDWHESCKESVDLPEDFKCKDIGNDDDEDVDDTSWLGPLDPSDSHEFWQESVDLPEDFRGKDIDNDDDEDVNETSRREPLDLPDWHESWQESVDLPEDFKGKDIDNDDDEDVDETSLLGPLDPPDLKKSFDLPANFKGNDIDDDNNDAQVKNPTEKTVENFYWFLLVNFLLVCTVIYWSISTGFNTENEPPN